MLTFDKAAELMGRGRNGRKKLGNNTYLEGRPDGLAVVLHQTAVVRLHPDGTYTLDSGGWNTVTTKNRINEFSPARLFQRDHEWFLQVGPGWDGSPIPFRDGIRIDRDGNPVNGEYTPPPPAPMPPAPRSLFVD